MWINHIVNFTMVFLIWMLCAYSIHCLSHYKPKYNPLFKIHKAHHMINYNNMSISFVPEWQNYFLWFGGVKESLDVWITLVLPAIVLVMIFPKYGSIILIIVYLYEVFLSETILDHNININGRITRFLACGVYHLKHHKNPKIRYGFYLTIWDYIFFTDDRNIPYLNKLLLIYMYNR